MLLEIVNSNAGDAALSKFGTANTWPGIQTFSAGVQFGGGTSTLNYFEEGPWTPAFTGSGVTVTYTSRTGSYQRIGNYVFLNATIVIATSTTTGAKVTVTGLPFTPAAGEAFSGSGILSSTSFNFVRGTLTTSFANSAFRVSAIASITSDGELTDTNLNTFVANGYTISINLSYKVA
jgi:hypothetical protein